MAGLKINSIKIFFCLLVAAILCYFTFQFQILNFWLLISINISVLIILTILLRGLHNLKKDFHYKNIMLGVFSAIPLYFVFWIGNILAPLLFPFAENQIAFIYNLSSEGNYFSILLILFFITSPGEEIFWRGLLQKWAMEKFGQSNGWLLAAFLYSLIHLASGNLILVMAALTAGLYWGYLYRQTGNLVPCIISHGLWAVGVFLLLPLI